MWGAFDQFLRELLAEHCGATRIRGYHVRPDSNTLIRIAQPTAAHAALAPSARAGVLGHVVTSGREYVAGDPAQGPLLADLAADGDEAWTWVWPVRDTAGVVGVLAVGACDDTLIRRADVRRGVGEFVTLCWRHVAELEELQIVRHTDQGSGVLTRNDFFSRAAAALGRSYADAEPVVVAVFVVEGLRRLDDRGCWRERDALIEQLGRLIARRIRSDDLVGRFADDRFVVLLRRLDSGLGRLIAGKIVSAAQTCITELPAVGEHVRVRVGLAGSGLGRPPLEELLVGAFEAVERARHADAALSADFEKPHGEVACGGPDGGAAGTRRGSAEGLAEGSGGGSGGGSTEGSAGASSPREMGGRGEVELRGTTPEPRA